MKSAINLFVEPRRVYAWREFVAQKPRCSIALDGFVSAQTTRQLSGPYANFDHHSGVDRFSTRSTSGQLMVEIRMGLFKCFREGGIPTANVYINDPDEDTCLGWWLLKNHEVVESGHPAVNRLVACEDILDCTAGAFPMGDTNFRRRLAWMFDPYSTARYAGRIAVMDAGEMRSIVEAVEQRISRYVFGDGGEEIALEGTYERIGGGPGWAFTKENSPASRRAMYQDGITAFVSLVAQKPDGSNVYVLGRRSAWDPFDLPGFYPALNSAEPPGLVTETNRWDGGDTTGGSPRLTGSKQMPAQVEAVINTLIDKG